MSVCGFQKLAAGVLLREATLHYCLPEVVKTVWIHE